MIQFIVCKHPCRLFPCNLVQDIDNISFVLIIDEHLFISVNVLHI